MPLRAARRLSSVFVVLALAVPGLSGCEASGPDAQIGATAPGDLIPVQDRVAAGNIGGPLVTGRGSAYLRSQKGHPVIVDFFAHWCSGCEVETPVIDSVYRGTRSAGVRALGFDTKDPGAGGAQFLDQHGIGFPFVSDEPGAALLGIGNIPATSLPVAVLIDKHQRIAGVYVRRFTAGDLEPAVAKLAAEH